MCIARLPQADTRQARPRKPPTTKAAASSNVLHTQARAGSSTGHSASNDRHAASVNTSSLSHRRHQGCHTQPRATCASTSGTSARHASPHLQQAVKLKPCGWRCGRCCTGCPQATQMQRAGKRSTQACFASGQSLNAACTAKRCLHCKTLSVATIAGVAHGMRSAPAVCCMHEPVHSNLPRSRQARACFTSGQSLNAACTANARCCNHSRCCSLHEICASGLLHEPVHCNLPRSATPICHALPRQCSRASSLSWFSTSLFQHQLVHCVATCQLWTSSCPTWPPSTWEPIEPRGRDLLGALGVSQLLFLCANRKRSWDTNM